MVIQTSRTFTSAVPLYDISSRSISESRLRVSLLTIHASTRLYAGKVYG